MRSNSGRESGAQPEPDSEKDIGQLRPIKEVADQVSLSLSRIQALLKDGKMRGELRLDEGYGKGLWYTSVTAVREYQKNLWTPQEWGCKGGLIAGRGRPKNSKNQP